MMQDERVMQVVRSRIGPQAFAKIRFIVVFMAGLLVDGVEDPSGAALPTIFNTRPVP
jgi:hypothetical protein